MTSAHFTLAEQETTITWSRADDEIRIWSAIPADIRELRRRVRAGLAREVDCDGDRWADFRIPCGSWSLKGFKRRVEISEERRRELGDRFRALRGDPA